MLKLKQLFSGICAVAIISGATAALPAHADYYRSGTYYNRPYYSAGTYFQNHPYVKKAAIGGGVGAVAGALLGGDGGRGSGAIKGALLGGAAGVGLQYLQNRGTFNRYNNSGYNNNRGWF